MLSEEQWQNVEKFAGADTLRLRLTYHGNDSMRDVIDQIECHQRAKKKLADTLASAPRFYFPTVLSSEQATSDTLAAYHASLIAPGSKVFDMTCGLGIDAFHIARTASQLFAADISHKVADAANYNAGRLGIDNFQAICADSVELLSQMECNAFDYIFIDPARRGDHGQRRFALSDCQPDVTSIIDRMIEVAPKVIVKVSPMLDISDVVSRLPHIERVISVGTRRECKELVIVCDRTFNGTPLISAVTVGENSFDFSEEDERNAVPVFGMPVPGEFLLECHPAAIKAGPFKLLSSRFGVKKIAPNTHLYYCDRIPDKFPGRGMVIREVLPFDKHARKTLLARYKAIDITARNFPLQPAEIAKKLKLQTGGCNRMFAVRDQYDKCWLIIAEPSI